MSSSRCRLVLLTLAVAIVLPSSLLAASVAQMNLAQMVGRADRIFRGTVTAVVAGSVRAGGGQIPTTTYRIKVEEAFKGSFDKVKDVEYAEIRMVGKTKPVTLGTRRLVSPLSLPDLKVGERYLLLTTARSAAGLSTTVGLGQGSFRVLGSGSHERAVNELNNWMLFKGMEGGGPAAELNREPAARPSSQGPIAYRDLAGQIQALVGR